MTASCFCTRCGLVNFELDEDTADEVAWHVPRFRGLTMWTACPKCGSPRCRMVVNELDDKLDALLMGFSEDDRWAC